MGLFQSVVGVSDGGNDLLCSVPIWQRVVSKDCENLEVNEPREDHPSEVEEICHPPGLLYYPEEIQLKDGHSCLSGVADMPMKITPVPGVIPDNSSSKGHDINRRQRSGALSLLFYQRRPWIKKRPRKKHNTKVYEDKSGKVGNRRMGLATEDASVKKGIVQGVKAEVERCVEVLDIALSSQHFLCVPQIKFTGRISER